MPVTGIIVVSLAIILFLGIWHRVLVLLFLVSGLFADAAIVNFSNFGLQPGYFVLLLVIGRAVAELRVRRERLERGQLLVFAPLLLFVVSSLAVLFLASAFFDGTIRVQASRDGLGSSGTPFHFRFENYAQHLYIITNGIGAL